MASGIAVSFTKQVRGYMEIFEIIKGHEIAVITASFALLGVLLTAVVTICSKWLDMRHARNMKKLELRSTLKKNNYLSPYCHS